MTIDFEDWFCAGNLSTAIPANDWKKCELRITDNSLRLLELLEKYDSKATFFVLGWIAERVPELVSRIDQQGHEIACHGYSHKPLHLMSKHEFDADLKRALIITKNIIHKEILGYRSPSFSLTPHTTWAYDILYQNGIKYDSSVFPFNFHPDYGFPGSAESFHLVKHSIMEIPLSVFNFMGLKIPFAGGGYFRLYPLRLTSFLMNKQNNKGKPFVFYLHPWEIDHNQPVLKVHFLKKFRHYYNLKKTYGKFEKVLSRYSFSTIRDILWKVNI